MSHDRDRPDHPVTSRLVDAVRQVRIDVADRNDVVVDLREATRTRLELLAEDLRQVIADIPADDERFDFALTSGLQPRFWIDATAHVMMAPDRRTYRFVRDTQLGRTVLGESDDRAVIADRIVSYVAMRIHERDVALAGEVTSYRQERPARTEARPAEKRTTRSDDPLERIIEALESLRREMRARDGEPSQPAQSAGRSPKDHDEAPEMRRERTPDAARPSPPAAAAIAPPPAPVQSAQPGPRGAMGQVQSIANAVVWVMLGIVIGAGALLLAFQNLLVQP